MPCTTSSLTEMQVDGGKGHLVAGHALEQRHGVVLGEKVLDRRVDLAASSRRADHAADQLVGLPDQQAGLAHLGHFSRRA